MFCYNCGTKYESDELRFCASCGASADGPQSAQFQQPYRYGYSHPPYGYPPQSKSAKTKVAAALLAFFLGSYGAHNFYLGHKKKAVAQLLMTAIPTVLMIASFVVMLLGWSMMGAEWLVLFFVLFSILISFSYILMAAVGIWAFVEFILILTGSIKDAQNLPLS